MADTDVRTDNPGSPAEAGFMGVVLIAMFSSLLFGFKTPETVVFFAMVLVWNVGLIDTPEALSGFSNPGMLANGALFVVIKGVEKSQLADKAARRVFGLRTSLSAGLARMMLLCFALSAFLNNTPVVALLIPITRDWARARGFSPSIFLIPLSYSCIFGGLLTLIGTSTNLVVQGLVLDEKLTDPTIEAIGFFEPGYIGLPMGVIGILYLVNFAPRVLPSRGGLFTFIRDCADELLTQVQVTKDFPYNGEPVELVLARLGLPQQTLIKIRRKIFPGFRDKLDQSLGKKRAAKTVCNLKTFSGQDARSYRERTELLWGTAEGLRQDNLSRSTSAAARPSAAVSDYLDVEEGNNSRSHNDIFPVTATEIIQAGDVLFLGCAQAAMIEFQAIMVTQGLNGLRFLNVSALDLRGHGTEFFEVVLSAHNHFVGRSACRDNAAFEKYYDGCSVVAVRRRGKADATNPAAISAAVSVSRHAMSVSKRSTASSVHSKLMDISENIMEEGARSSVLPAIQREVSSASSGAMGTQSASSGATAAESMQSSGHSPIANARPAPFFIPPPPMPLPIDPEEDGLGEDTTETPFKAGDVVLVLAKEGFMEKYRGSKNFLLLTKVGSVPKPVQKFDYLPLLVFLGMLAWVLLGADMVQAAFAAGGIMILSGWVGSKHAVGYVNWRLLLLIGSALGLSKGVVNSGLATYVGTAIRNSGMSADGSLFVICAFTMACTEAITNNAAAALATPIAFEISRELGVSYKPFVMTVMLAASWSFITPIGYQTNTLVWGPGGYKFADFVKIGSPLSLTYLVVGCLLIPRVFPF